MTKRRQTSIKVDALAWDKAKEILKEYNMSVTDGINIFLNKVRLEGGIPFDIKVPNDRLKKSIQEVEKGEVVHYDNVEDMMKDLKS
jgi:DNA-damage-inducible protein J